MDTGRHRVGPESTSKRLEEKTAYEKAWGNAPDVKTRASGFQAHSASQEFDDLGQVLEFF